MSTTTVSAIITTHRRPEQLVAAIDSVLRQTSPVAEVLVVEDGEDLATARAVASRAHVAPIRHLRVRAGAVCPAASRNLGISVAQGSHVAFLDDDDTWRPDKIEVQVPDCHAHVLVCGNARRTDGHHYFPGNENRVVGLSELDRHNPVITSTALVQRDALLRVGGFSAEPRLRGVEDFDAWLRLAERFGPFRYLGKSLAEYECAHEVRLSSDHLLGELRLALVRARALGRRPISPRRWRSVARSGAGVLMAIGKACRPG